MKFLFVSILLSIASSNALYGSNSPVVQLNEKNFKEKVLRDDGIWIVEFFAPWCGHCKSLTPEYEKAASQLKGIVNIGAVDATADENLARKYDIKGFPTIKIFSKNKNSPTDYQGQRTADGIVTEALSSVRQLVKDRQSGKKSETKSNDSKKERKDKPKRTKDAVVELTSENFEDIVLNSEEEWIVKFVAPWCGHCKNLAPEWKTAAQELSGTVNSGSVDCTVHADLAQKYGVQGYPTIMIFPPGKKGNPITYQGARESQAIVSEALRILESSGVDPSVRQITDQSVLDKACAGSNRICVIATLPHILEGGKLAREGYLATLMGAAKKMRSTVFSFLWTEVGVQSDLEQVLGLTFGSPAVVAMSKDKGVYAVHVGAFDESHVASFLKGVLSGATKTKSFGVLPGLLNVDEWDGKDAAPVEEEFSLEELFAEEL